MARAKPGTAYFVRALIQGEALPYARTALSWLVWNTWPLVPGLLAKLFFDALADRAPGGLGVTTVVALLIASGAGRAIAMRGAVGAGVPMRFRMQTLLQGNILARILHLPGASALQGSVGEAISTLRDDVEAGALAADWPYDAFAGFVFGVGGIAILFSVNARITLLVFLPISLLLALANVARSRLVRVRERSRQATAHVTGAIAEIFSAVQAIQVAGAQDRVLAHLGRLGDARRRAMVTDTVAGLGFDATFRYTMNLGAGCVLLLGAAQMRAGTFSVGDFALFATYLMQVADFMGFLGYLISSYQQCSVSFERMLRVMQGAPPEALVRPAEAVSAMRPPESSLQPLESLTIRGLHCTQQGRRGVLEASLVLQRGTLTAVTGTLGAGKTTLLRAVLGLLPTEGGEILWNERIIEDPGTFLVPPRAAYVPQTPSLFSGTLRDNVLLGEAATEEDLAEAARAAAFSDDLAAMPQGWETQVGSGGVRLSGGQAQRVAIARALVRRAELLVLDDVSSALDRETERLLWVELLRLRGTYLIATSSAFILQQARQVIWMQEGRIAAIGSFEQLAHRGLQSR